MLSVVVLFFTTVRIETHTMTFFHCFFVLLLVLVLFSHLLILWVQAGHVGFQSVLLKTTFDLRCAIQ